MALKIPAGIDGIPTSTIPDDPKQFVGWFKSVGIKRWLANADVRNAVQGTGVYITGSVGTPATISVTGAISGILDQPFLLLGTPVAPTVFTDYRKIAVQSGVLSLTDGGATNNLTVGVVNGGIGPTQLSSVVNVDLALAVTALQSISIATGTGLTGGPLAASGSTVSLSAGSIASLALANSALQAANVADSITTSGGNLQLVGDSASPGNSYSYGTNAAGTKGWYANSTIGTSANPSATIGLTAVNGTATTYMTSDSAPALSQAIAPTWTNNHKWLITSGNALTINGGANHQTTNVYSGGSTWRAVYAAGYNDGTNHQYSRWGMDASNSLLSDSSNGDTCMVASGSNMRFSAGGISTTQLLINAVGAVSIAAPGSGAGLTVSGSTSIVSNGAILGYGNLTISVSSGVAIYAEGPVNTFPVTIYGAAGGYTGLTIVQSGQTAATFYQPASSNDARIQTNNTDRVAITGAGNVTVNVADSGDSLTVSGTTIANGILTHANIINANRTIAADTSYIVVQYLNVTVGNILTVSGNLRIL
ncbi:MAG: hypothetical protein ACLQKH_15170 [Steroidobacteraceae bacterium]